MIHCMLPFLERFHVSYALVAHLGSSNDFDIYISLFKLRVKTHFRPRQQTYSNHLYVVLHGKLYHTSIFYSAYCKSVKKKKKNTFGSHATAGQLRTSCYSVWLVPANMYKNRLEFFNFYYFICRHFSSFLFDTLSRGGKRNRETVIPIIFSFSPYFSAFHLQVSNLFIHI